MIVVTAFSDTVTVGLAALALHNFLIWLKTKTNQRNYIFLAKILYFFVGLPPVDLIQFQTWLYIKRIKPYTIPHINTPQLFHTLQPISPTFSHILKFIYLVAYISKYPNTSPSSLLLQNLLLESNISHHHTSYYPLQSLQQL